jgi:hypothetical protein
MRGSNAMRASRSILGMITAAGGCLADDLDGPCAGREATAAIVDTPVLSEPCDVESASPTRLLVTTTDFATGALSVVDLATGEADVDVAVAGTDSLPAWHDGRALLVHRFQLDYVEVLDPGAGWATRAEYAMPGECSNTPNPQSIAFGPDGLAYVPELASPEVVVLDPNASPSTAIVDAIDLGAFADDDGNPEASLAVVCGDTLWVSVQHLDPSFVRVGDDELVAIDMERRSALDLDATTAGAQGLRSRGEWIRQIRRDPTDPSGHRVLALSTGIERFDLAAGTVEWAVDPELFERVGLDAMRLLQSFDVDDDGAVAYVAAYQPDFTEVRLWRVGLDGGEPGEAQEFASGFDSVERTLELVGTTLWYGSTRAGEVGLWRFDMSQWPPVRAEAPLSLGLPPYSMVAIP